MIRPAFIRDRQFSAREHLSNVGGVGRKITGSDPQVPSLIPIPRYLMYQMSLACPNKIRANHEAPRMKKQKLFLVCSAKGYMQWMGACVGKKKVEAARSRVGFGNKFRPMFRRQAALGRLSVVWLLCGWLEARARISAVANLG